MQKTLAQFKRDIKIGDSILCLKIEEGKSLWPDQGYTPLAPIDLKPKMQGLRLVIDKDTTGFYLKGISDDSRRGSFCNYPKSRTTGIHRQLFYYYRNRSSRQYMAKALLSNNKIKIWKKYSLIWH